VPANDVNRTIDAVWRIESARLIAGLARIARDVGVAEDLAQEALVAALEQWPESGVPDNPGAWLMGTAKHRAVDRLRRAEVHERRIDWRGPFVTRRFSSRRTVCSRPGWPRDRRVAKSRKRAYGGCGRR
jgi:DNA-directed RNA polymerase specialized sigma24 family protein